MPAAEGPAIEIQLQGLASLDPAIDGNYEIWMVDASALVRSAGRPELPANGAITIVSPVGQPTHVMVTIEPPGDHDDTPSLLKLVGGKFEDSGVAELELTGYLTPVGIPLEEAPGVHILATVAAGHAGERPDAGLWLVNSQVDSSDASYFQTFTPLTKGWAYEGWIVRDRSTPGEIWLSYGQFLPNNIRKARFRDDTGIGPFSGFADYERALIAEIHYPGDDWIANPHSYSVPGGLALPLDLNGDASSGERSRWIHVITIEPRPEADGVRTESPWEARPFFLRPYENEIGEAPPDEPRTIRFLPQSLPRGVARIMARQRTE